MTSESLPEFDPVPILSALSEAGVDFVVVGGLAAGVHGSAYPTYDVDVVYARDRANLEKLADALTALGARLRGAPPDVPFLLDVETLERGAHFTFETHLGSVDILHDPVGAPPYAALKNAARRETVGGRAVRFAALDHLIAMKEATGRGRDKVAAMELRAISDQLRSPGAND